MHWVSASSVTGTPRQTSSRKRSLETSLPCLAHQQGQRVEIAGVELDRRAVPLQPPVAGVEQEAFEAEAAVRHVFRRTPGVAQRHPSKRQGNGLRANEKRRGAGPGVDLVGL